MLHDLDTSLFLWLNGQHTPWLDTCMWYVSTRWLWIPLYVWMLYVLFRKYPERSFILLLFIIALCIGLNDIMASTVFKPMVARLRPSHQPELASLVHVVTSPDGGLYRGGLYGFYSSHAANLAAAITMFIVLARPKKSIAAFLLAVVFLVGYSRIYLGVHYPSDILMGFMVGSASGYGISKWFVHRTKTRGAAA